MAAIAELVSVCAHVVLSYASTHTMPVIPFAASTAPLSWAPPSVAALNPAVRIAAKSVEVKRKMPRVPELRSGVVLGDGDGFGEGEGLGDGEGLGEGIGDGDGLGDGDGGGGAAAVSSGRMSPTLESAECTSKPTP